MKKSSVIIAISFLVFNLYSQYYIRYNNLGYLPEFRKNILILSNQNLKNLEWKLTNHTNKTIRNGKIGNSLCAANDHTPFLFNYEIDLSDVKSVGDYHLSVGDSAIDFEIDPKIYNTLPSEILRFFRVQRSGTEDCLDHKISHLGDKACIIHRRKTEENTSWELIDSIPKKVDMLGGWYDAGDFVKFTLTTAYTTYLMLLAYEQNPELLNYKKYSKSGFNDVLDEAAWGLDYLLKSYADTTEFIIQVGGFKDHQQGIRLPENDNLNGQREAYSGFSPTQMAYTAAALALGANTFKNIDSVRAHKYKKTAIALYKKAITLKDCHWVKQGWEEFYPDKSPYDNFLLAAIELKKLTGNASYEKDIENFSLRAGQGYWASWGNINLLAQLRAEDINQFGEQDLSHFQSIAKENGNIWGTPHKYTWSSLYSFLTVGNGALISKDSSFKDIYQNVVNYTLGCNNWGMALICSEKINNCACETFSNMYKLQAKLVPYGAVAEGPGDRETHEKLKQYFSIPANYPLEKFNSKTAVFYNLETDFQTMETTIVGQAEALLFFSLLNKSHQ